MRVFARFGLFAIVALAALAPASVIAQDKPAAKPGTTADAGPDLNQVLATVNGDPITRGQFLNFVGRTRMPDGDPAQIYKDAIDSLVNTRLIYQYLNRQKIPVSEAKVDELVANLEKQVKADGSSLAEVLLRTQTSMAQVRKEYGDIARWIDFLNTKATDAELQKYFDNHKDLFRNTQVRASHILLRVEPNATAEEKAKVRKKLEAIRHDIESKKITFAEAANKNSEDPSNSVGAGGDVGYFGLSSGFVPEFSDVAFATKVGAISPPFETYYGEHILTITDRKEGQKVDMEQIKPAVRQQYGLDLQKAILTGERKNAKIDIKPMPADLIQVAPVPAPAEATPAKEKPAPK